MSPPKKSICIVASTLPARFIASQAEYLDIDKIIVASENLELSYQFIKNDHPTIEIVCAPRGYLVLVPFYLSRLIWARLCGNSVVIFHECCFTLLDLLILVVKPSGFYFPQVTMSGWTEIEFEHFPAQKLTYLIKNLGLVHFFKFYRSSAIGDYLPEYAMSLIKYPDSIVSKDVGFVRELLAQSKSRFDGKSKKILFLVGKSCVSDDVQHRLYNKLITIAYVKGFACYIKDHPNPIFRLNLHSIHAASCDPLIPFEMMDEDFYLYVGVTSTALLAYDERSISLLNMMDEMTAEDSARFIMHFEKASPGNNIKYINSFDEFEKLLEE